MKERLQLKKWLNGITNVLFLSVPACCDTDSIAGVCGDLLQDTVGLDGTVVAGG